MGTANKQKIDYINMYVGCLKPEMLLFNVTSTTVICLVYPAESVCYFYTNQKWFNLWHQFVIKSYNVQFKECFNK